MPLFIFSSKAMDRSHEFRSVVEKEYSAQPASNRVAKRSPSPFLMKANEVVSQPTLWALLHETHRFTTCSMCR